MSKLQYLKYLHYRCNVEKWERWTLHSQRVLLLLQTRLMFTDKRRVIILDFNTLELWKPHSIRLWEQTTAWSLILGNRRDWRFNLTRLMIAGRVYTIWLCNSGCRSRKNKTSHLDLWSYFHMKTYRFMQKNTLFQLLKCCKKACRLLENMADYAWLARDKDEQLSSNNESSGSSKSRTAEATMAARTTLKSAWNLEHHQICSFIPLSTFLIMLIMG